jgi:homoserine kinase
MERTSISQSKPTPGLRLILPATSANLGPGFDAAGLALSMHLSIEAHATTTFSIHATGRNTDLIADTGRNLILDTYRNVLLNHNRSITPLKLTIHNEIPLGAGCGSSAAALLAGLALADHFGSLNLGDAGIVAEASWREGHPDNVAACWYGGFTTSVQSHPKSAARPGEAPPTVEVATFPGNPAWELVLTLQPTSLATKEARALLPDTYSRADAVFNIQRAALLVAAFAQGRLDLLRTATQDRLHQPYRSEACPLLAQLLPLAAEPEIASVSLSGAGPSVLILLAETTTFLEAEIRLRQLLAPEVELISLRIATGATRTVLTTP